MVVLAAMVSAAVPQKAKAENYNCDITATIGLIFIATITFAPTGTTVLLGLFDCRDEVLALQEDAKQYKITGEASPYLASVIEGVMVKNPKTTPEEITTIIINGQVAPN